VSSIRHGGYMRMLIVFTASDSDSKTQLESEIGAEASVLDVGGTLSTLLSHTQMNESASLSVTAVRGGLDAETTNLADLIAAGISAETLDRVRDLEGNLAKSVRVDSCNDSGQCPTIVGDDVTCEPCADATNYFDNPSRDSTVMGVHLGAYNKLFSSSSSFKPTYDQIRQQWHEIEKVTRDLSNAQEGMEAAYRTEIEPFLEATVEDQVFYNVREGKPHTSADAVRGVANDWAARFSPETGTDILAISDHLRECWGKAADDVNFTCTTTGMANNEEVDLLVFANEGLDAYPRVAKIAATTSRAFSDDVEEGKFNCLRAQPAGSFALPTPEEAAILAPIIDGADIVWPVGFEREIYVDSDQCTSRQEAVYKLENGEGRVECLTDERRATVCVDAAGPFVE
jgi:hypothetical protein